MRLLDIPFQHGQDEKVDPKIAPAGVLKAARNVRRTKDGRWSKRNGYTSLGLTPSSGSLSNVVNVSAIKDELLLVGRDGNGTERAYSRNVAQSRWMPRGMMPSVSAPTRTGIQTISSGPAKKPDMAITNGHACVVYEAFSTIYAHVIELATGAIIHETDLSGGSGTFERPKVVACGNTFCVTYIDTTPAGNNEIKLHTWVTGSSSAFASAGTIINNMINTSSYYDTCGFDATQFLIIYNHSNSTSMNITLHNTAGTITDSVNFAVTQGPPSIFGAAGENVTAAWRAGNDIVIQTFDSALTSVVGPTTINTDASNQLMPSVVRFSSTHVWVVWSGDNSSSNDQFVRWRLVNRSNHTLGNLQTLSGHRLASKPLFVDANLWAWTVTKSTFDRVYTLFVLEDNSSSAQKRAQTWVARSEALDFVQADDRCSLLSSGSSLYFAFPRIARGLVSASSPHTAVDYCSVERFGKQRLQTAEVDGLLYQAGGQLMVYDGQTQDLGFGVAPELISLTAGAGGSMTSSATYQFVLIREYYDASGKRWRSVPSSPLSVTLGGAQTSVSINYTKAKSNHYKNGVINHIYRTLANGVVFYRMSPDQGTAIDSTDSFGQNTYGVSPSDATIQANEILYTQGVRGGLSGLLENSPPPPCRYIWAGRDRVIVGGLENRSMVQWSKRFYPGEPLNFSNTDGFRTLIPGIVTAVAELDGVWIVFTENAIYAVTGDGPDDNGEGSFFSPPQRIPSDVGCIDWRSVVAVPHGLLFQASKDRIYLLPRGGAAPVFIGSAVQATLAALTSSAEITDVELIADENICVFTVQDGATGLVLVYDTRTGEWSIDTDAANPMFVSAALWNGDLILATSSAVYSQSTAYADTGGAFISSLLETGEIRPGGLNSNVRIRKAAVLGEYRGAHQLKLEASIDDGLTYPYSVTWTNTGMSVGEQIQRVWRLPVQKVGSIKFRVSDLTNGSATEGIALHGLTLEVEPRGGVNRLREAYRG